MVIVNSSPHKPDQYNCNSGQCKYHEVTGPSLPGPSLNGRPQLTRPLRTSAAYRRDCPRCTLQTLCGTSSPNPSVGIAAASPSGQNVRPIMFSARYCTLSTSFFTPPPAYTRVGVKQPDPVRALAAGNTPAAALMLVELDRPQRKLNNRNRLIQHHNTA